MCFGGVASPYESEEILYLSTVAALIRKEPFLINLFLPSHQHSAFVNARLGSDICRLQKFPIRNPLFDEIDNKMRRIALVADVPEIPISTDSLEKHPDDAVAGSSNCICVEESAEAAEIQIDAFECDCDNNEDRLALLDSILGYFDSPVSRHFIN